MEKTKFMHQLDERFGEPIEGLLKRLYVEQKKSGIQISKELGLKESTVYKLLRWFDIPRRSLLEACRGKQQPESFRKKMRRVMRGRKISWADKISKAMKGKKKSKAHRKHIAEGHKGLVPWNRGLKGVQRSTRKGKTWEDFYGEERAKEIKQKLRASLSKSKEKRRKISQKLWKNPKFTKKTLTSLFQKPNRSEKKLIRIIQKHNLPFKYAGRGEVLVEGRIPDFIATDGSKKVIELFGRPWHDPSNEYHSSKIGYHRTEKGRIEFFANYGYTCLVIWTDELRDETAVVDKIKAFMSEKTYIALQRHLK